MRSPPIRRGPELDEFEWRLSMAEVASDGAFSRFEGIDRTLCLLDGSGIILSFADRDVEITTEAGPFSFPGEMAVAARLLGGPILDLNVMTRRMKMHHNVEQIAVKGPTSLSPLRPIAIVCRDGNVAVAGTTYALTPRDCLMPGGAAADITLGGEGTVFVVSLG